MEHKKMRLLLLLFILISASNVTTAQTRFGIKTGLSFSNVKEKTENGSSSSTQSLPGLLIGLTAESRLIGDFYIQPALLYTRKGFKQKSGGFYGSATNFKVKADYIELPVNFLYKPKVGMGNLIIGVGPYISYGTGGKWKSDSDITLGDIRIAGEGSVVFRNDGSVRNDSEYTYGRPFDYGFNATLGYEFRKSLTLQVTGMAGVANLVPRFNDYQPEGSLRNKSLGITIGYKL